jgi:predicted dehydrogenase
VFFDCYVHEVNEMLSWAGADWSRAVAFGGPVGAAGANDEVPDTVTGTVEFENGVRASICFSQVSKTTNDTYFGIVGTTGRIDGDPWQPEGAGSLWVYTDGGLFRTQVIVSGEKASRGHLGFREQYDFFVRGVAEGRALICDIEDGIRTQRLMAALDRSLSEGRVVHRDEFG